MTLLYPELVHGEELLSVPELALLPEGLLLHDGVHPQERLPRVLEARLLGIVEALRLVLVVALEREVAGVTVRVPLVAGLVIAGAAQLAGLDVAPAKLPT